MDDLLNAKYFDFLPRLAMMRADSDETLSAAACGPGPFWCSSRSTVQTVEICALKMISEKTSWLCTIFYLAVGESILAPQILISASMEIKYTWVSLKNPSCLLGMH